MNKLDMPLKLITCDGCKSSVASFKRTPKSPDGYQWRLCQACYPQAHNSHVTFNQMCDRKRRAQNQSVTVAGMRVDYFGDDDCVKVEVKRGQASILKTYLTDLDTFSNWDLFITNWPTPKECHWLLIYGNDTPRLGRLILIRLFYPTDRHAAPAPVYYADMHNMISLNLQRSIASTMELKGGVDVMWMPSMEATA